MNGSGMSMKYWIAYLREKRNVIILFLVTIAIFLIMGFLCQTENMGILLYAALLSLVIWAAAGFFSGMRYVQQCGRLDEVLKYLENSQDTFLDLLWGSERNWTETAMESHTKEGELLRLLRLVGEKHMTERRRWEEKSADRSDYYSMWTHQIKTPIAAVKLLLVSRKGADKNDFLLREELFKIEQYVEMALAYQRLESISSDLVLQEYDLYTLLKQAVKKYSVLFINKELTLQMEDQKVAVLTDEKWFVFCIEQFLSNSIKYTNSGKISLWSKVEEDEVHLFIEDTGIGIRSEDLPRIFERGFTGYNGRLDKRSTGIGLYLCKRVLDHLSISVRVESQTGQNARVESQSGQGTRVELIVTRLTKM